MGISGGRVLSAVGREEDPRRVERTGAHLSFKALLRYMEQSARVGGEQVAGRQRIMKRQFRRLGSGLWWLRSARRLDRACILNKELTELADVLNEGCNREELRETQFGFGLLAGVRRS